MVRTFVHPGPIAGPAQDAASPRRRLRRSNAGERPSIHGSGTLAHLLDRHKTWRVPEGANGIHVGKLDHKHRPLVAFALEHFDRCASGDDLAATLRDKWNDHLTIL